jgi:putative endonuclease
VVGGGSGDSQATRALAEFLGQGHTVGRGRVAEDAAERYLVESGYRIVARNWTCKAGEIDVVAFDGAVLCFVEVKARSSPEFGPAIAAVDRRKQHRIARAASWLLAGSGYRGACRFDVLGLDRNDTGWRYTLIRGAFEA